MVKGVLTVLLCPMMDEQLFHSLKNENEPHRVVLLENQASKSTGARMKSRGIEFESVPEEKFVRGFITFPEDEFTIVIRVNSLGLHAEPLELKKTVEDEIQEMQPYTDVVALYYGTCGNALWDVSEWCRKEGLKPTVILRNDYNDKVVDDCIGVWIGNGHTYTDLVRKYTGMLLVTPSVADNWVEFMTAGDMASGFRHLDPVMAEIIGGTDIDSYMRWMFRECGYMQALKIETGFEPDPEAFEKSYRDVLRRVELKPITIEKGWVTIEPADNLYQSAKALMGDDRGAQSAREEIARGTQQGIEEADPRFRDEAVLRERIRVHHHPRHHQGGGDPQREPLQPF